MIEHKFTDDEIIKALECCVQKREFRYCDEKKCPLCNVGTTYSECKEFLVKEIIDRYNRQKANLQEVITLNSKLEAEIARLEETLNATITGQETLQKNLPKVIKAEAIKEFAERLKSKEYETSVDAYSVGYILGADEIDNLVKEMTEEEE